MSRSRRNRGFVAALALSVPAVLAVLAVIAGTAVPAYADGSTPVGQASDQLQHRSATATFPADEVRDRLQQITIRSVAGESKVVTQATPSCTGDWARINIFVEWWYNTRTRLTEASAADWGGSVNCVGMAYMSARSTLSFRGAEVASGSHNSCGHVGAPWGNCGSVPTSGDWGCGGVGSCDGNYYATLGLWVDLPDGSSWGAPPDDCSVEFGGKTLLCVFDTGTVHVPRVN
jgi:hypothetical protein